MKIKKIILFMFILFMPLMVNALEVPGFKEEYPTVVGTGAGRDQDQYGMISEEYVYEDGKYKLTGNVVETTPSRYPFSPGNELKVVYKCWRGKETECSTLYAVLPSIKFYFHGFVALSIELRNGQDFNENMIYAYYSDEYEELENGKYRLINPTRVSLPDIEDKTDKYVCGNLYEYDDCDSVSLIIHSTPLYMMVDTIPSRIALSNSYTYKDGQYVLNDVVRVNLVYNKDDEYEGMYTCFNTTGICETIYKYYGTTGLAIELELTVIPPVTINYATLMSTVEETDVSIEFDDSADNSEEDYYIEDIEETDQVIVEDEEIIEVKLEERRGKVIPKKEGETDVTIISEEDDIRVIHFAVKGVKKPAVDSNDDVNPNTIDLILVALILLIFSGTMFFISKKRFDRQ